MTALLQVARTAELIYSDEDTLAINGLRSDPYFKPDWNPELLLSQNYVCCLAVLRTARVRAEGGFRPCCEGAQNHDLLLRCTEGLGAEQVVHIPHVLYHRRANAGNTAGQGKPKPYALQCGLRAREDALARRGLAGTVEADAFGWHSVRLACPSPAPLVTIVVPTRDGTKTLPRCWRSLAALTRYPAWQLLIVDNGSADPDFLAELARIAQDPRVDVLRDDSPFNYAALNNRAVAQAEGAVVVLLNDDTEVISPGWLDELVAWAMLPGIGAVGARLWFPDGMLQHGGVVLGIGIVAGHLHSHLLRGQPGQRGRALVLQSFSAVTGACLAVRRDRYLAVGGLDATNFAVAFNDVDFCLKLGRLGLRNVSLPTVELTHFESASRGSDREARHHKRYEKEAALNVQPLARRTGGRPGLQPQPHPAGRRRVAGLSAAREPATAVVAASRARVNTLQAIRALAAGHAMHDAFHAAAAAVWQPIITGCTYTAG